MKTLISLKAFSTALTTWITNNQSQWRIKISYVDGLLDRQKEKVFVVERVDGKRIYKEYPINYVFYYEDGKFLTCGGLVGSVIYYIIKIE